MGTQEWPYRRQPAVSSHGCEENGRELYSLGSQSPGGLLPQLTPSGLILRPAVLPILQMKAYVYGMESCGKVKGSVWGEKSVPSHEEILFPQQELQGALSRKGL